MSVFSRHIIASHLSLSFLFLGAFSLLFLSSKLSLPDYGDASAGREERDLGRIYCTVKPGWKRRIPSDLRS